MKLSICVPHYNEPWETCGFLFDTIGLQRGIDFKDIEVLVGNDGDDKPLTFMDFGEYPYEVTVYNFPHRGVSATRNALLDKAQGDYVMFCDADDGFCQMYGLHLLMSKMEMKPDAIISSFVEEGFDAEDKFRLIRHQQDMNFIHGKAYRREFLTERNLRFKDDLTIHEDGYFNTLVALEGGENGVFIDNPFYIWRWNDNSVVRRSNDELFLMKTYGNLMDVRMATCEEMQERGFISEYYDAVCKTVIEAYYEFQKPDFLNPDNAKYVKRAERHFKRFYEKHHKDYNECNIKRVAEIMQICRTNAFAQGFRVEQWTITEWLNHIVNEVK